MLVKILKNIKQLLDISVINVNIVFISDMIKTIFVLFADLGVLYNHWTFNVDIFFLDQNVFSD